MISSSLSAYESKTISLLEFDLYAITLPTNSSANFSNPVIPVTLLYPSQSSVATTIDVSFVLEPSVSNNLNVA